ncbi:MAG: PAS domain-containing protein, partial [Candidatus Heimdallarchaeota archaeon]|nr:PAS domain-containing protein [Candidatus Heimdallarchaeota archaeon]
MAEQQNKGFNLHQNIFNLSESPEVIVDGSGNLIEYNHAFNKLMKLDDNFNHRKIKSINFFKKIINYKPQIKSKFNEIVFHKHLEVNLLDNSKIIADVKISQLFDSQENIVYHCRISDITNELYKYEQVQQSNEILERIFQNTHFMIAYLDIHFNFVRVNKAYAEVENKEPSFFMNKNHFDLYPNVDAERIFQDVVDTKIPFNIEGMPFTYNNNPERGITYWNWSLNPVLNTEGEVIGLLLALVDVSDLKKSEFRLTHRLKFEKLISKINDKFVKSKNFDDTIFHTLEDIQSISKSD